MEQKGFEMTFKEDWRWKSQGGILGKDSIESWENFGWGSEKGFARDLCIPTQNPNQLKNSWHTPTNNSICVQHFVSGLDSG
jgi:hypothetical protein